MVNAHKLEIMEVKAASPAWPPEFNSLSCSLPTVISLLHLTFALGCSKLPASTIVSCAGYAVRAVRVVAKEKADSRECNVLMFQRSAVGRSSATCASSILHDLRHCSVPADATERDQLRSQRPYADLKQRLDHSSGDGLRPAPAVPRPMRPKPALPGL